VVPLTIFLDDILLAYNLATVFAGVWWLCGVLILAPRMKDRQGRAWPDGKNILQLSISGLCETVTQMRELPQSRNFLLCWFLLSDGVSVQVTVGALFANSFVEWGCIPKGIGLAVVILMIPLFGIIGNFGALWGSKRYGWKPKSVVQTILLVAGIVPLYGLLGLFTDSVGLHRGYELFYIAPILGVASALTQAFSRSVFVTLIPAGYESSWSSLFELTNKSSSFVGPAIIAAVAQAGVLRLGFVYILFMLVVPAIALFWVDERLGAREARSYSKTHILQKLATPAIDRQQDKPDNLSQECAIAL
jgi:UMF1 family MFS transporter